MSANTKAFHFDVLLQGEFGMIDHVFGGYERVHRWHHLSLAFCIMDQFAEVDSTLRWWIAPLNESMPAINPTFGVQYQLNFPNQWRRHPSRRRRAGEKTSAPSE